MHIAILCSLHSSLTQRLYTDKLENNLQEFHKEAHRRYNVERLVVARVGDIVVREVSGPFEIRENDGCERIERVGDVGHRRIVHL